MRSIRDMETVQIEITNACVNNCSNCTRLCGHHKLPYYLTVEYVIKCCESLKDFPHMVGIMGGEPLIHPEFEQISRVLQEYFPKERCGLWTCLPKGKEYHAQTICDVYGNIFLNDHTRDDVLHHPVLVSADELVSFKPDMWYLIDKCWVQNCWSACINPRGAFFCEVAGALAMTLEEGEGWKVENGWTWKTPIDYVDQMRRYCTQCGCAMPVMKRFSVEGIDDISPIMYEKLKDKSPKLKRGAYKIHDLKLKEDSRKVATYKDEFYRKVIANRYNMIVLNNDRGYMTPYMKRIGGS